jgi:predicted MFS family arabinose efflux permease
VFVFAMTRRHGGNARWPENVDVFMSDAGGAASGVPGSSSPPVGAPAGLGAPKAESSPAGKPHGRRMDKGLVILLAVATGTAVASNYYAQPLLPTIRRTFDAGAGAAGLIVTASQIGYAIGLLLLLPLGDLLERRRLVVVLSLVTALGLVGAGLVPNLDLLYVAAVIVGTTTVVGQILVAFAASLASDDERGKVVGTVMSGLFIGILLARTVAGFLGEAFGWRGVYYVAGGLALVLAVVLRRALPSYREDVHLSYPAVLLSVVAIFREQPILRRRAMYGALAFAAFSVLWTSLAFLLAGPPFHYRSGTIGLFGLVGVAGAVMATVAGRLADRGLQAAMTVVTSAVLLVSFVLLWVGQSQLIVLLVAIVLLDLGCQGLHITNQSEIYRLLPQARSRVNASYMTSYFAGGTIGSVGSALCYEAFGWHAVCGLGAGFGAAALALAMGERRFGRRLAASRLAAN